MNNWNNVERISSNYWRNSQLSVARFYGGIKINGKMYILDESTGDLIREDIYRKMIKEAKKNKRIQKEEMEKLWMKFPEMS